MEADGIDGDSLSRLAGVAFKYNIRVPGLVKRVGSDIDPCVVLDRLVHHERRVAIAVATHCVRGSSGRAVAGATLRDIDPDLVSTILREIGRPGCCAGHIGGLAEDDAAVAKLGLARIEGGSITSPVADGSCGAIVAGSSGIELECPAGLVRMDIDAEIGR